MILAAYRIQRTDRGSLRNERISRSVISRLIIARTETLGKGLSLRQIAESIVKPVRFPRPRRMNSYDEHYLNLGHPSATWERTGRHLILDRPASICMMSCRVIMPMTFSSFTTGSLLTPNSAINFNARSRESFAPNEYSGRPVSCRDET